MVYQAFRSRYPHSVPVSARAEIAFILDSPSWRVPAAPVRSSFAEAFADVKRLRASGWVAAVRSLSFNNSTTI